MATPETIPEDEVTVAILQSLFERAYFNTEIDEDGDLVVRSGDSPVYLEVLRDANLIGYSVYFNLRGDTSPAEKWELTNEMNDSLVMARFSIRDNDTDILIADYHLSFEGGVLALQIVSTLRVFLRIVSMAVRDYDRNGLIE